MLRGRTVQCVVTVKNKHSKSKLLRKIFIFMKNLMKMTLHFTFINIDRK